MYHLCSFSYPQVLLNAKPTFLTFPDHQGSLPSHHASIHSTAETLNILLNFKPPKNSSVVLDVNQTDKSSRTCLHYAVAYGRLEAAAALVSRGAQVDVEDGEGKTVMDYAMELTDGKEEMLAVLRGT